MRPLLLGLAVVVLAAAGRSDDKKPAPKNLVSNGSFEDGPEVAADTPFVTADADSTAITGWTVTRGQIDVVTTYWKAADGKRSLDLHGSPGVGGVKQTIPTEKGKAYKVTFKLAGNPNGPKTKELTVVAGSVTKVFTFDSSEKTVEEMGWKEDGFEFTATGSKTDLELYSTTKDDDSSGPALDDVKVVEVEKSSK